MSDVEEQVALADAEGHVIGSAPRSLVRRRNLWHLGTGVIVRDRLGRVYVHRRTSTKDVFPSCFDCCAGGVVAAGESPEDAARRELAEELGIRGAPLTPVLRSSYADDSTRYHAYVYEALWDGPVQHQPEEVAEGGWMDIEVLAERLANPAWPFVPDGRALAEDWLRARLVDRHPVAGGWDSVTTLVESRWIDRVPRRPDVAARLLTETKLLPWLAPRLPLSVPEPVVMSEDPIRVRHVVIPGAAVQHPPAEFGALLGRFLRALHEVRPLDAVARGVPDAEGERAARRRSLARFRREVLPLVRPELRGSAERLLSAMRHAPATTLVHGDLGPDHLIVDDGRLVGVIDWSDATVGDPALDLSWGLHGGPPEFATALAEAYGVDAELFRRSLLWHRLGPWHEVTYGIDTAQPAFVESGLAGVHSRLRLVTPTRPQEVAGE